MTTEATAAAAITQPALAISLVDGEDDANVLAKLLKKHVEDIVAADPSKAGVALGIDGKLGVHSTDPDVAVTLIFGPDGLRIKNGFEPGLDGAITGPLKLQTETLAGIANPYSAMLRRKLKVSMRWSRPLFTMKTYGFLKVPKSMLPPQ